MMKVINLISILMGGLILQNSMVSSSLAFNPSLLAGGVVALLTVAIAIALWYSKRETEIIQEKETKETKKGKQWDKRKTE
jgi:L-lactate permease